jgi:hypothetical protein
VAQAVEDFLTDFQKRLLKVKESTILNKLIKDETAMQVMADKTLLAVQQAIGLRTKV